MLLQSYRFVFGSFAPQSVFQRASKKDVIVRVLTEYFTKTRFEEFTARLRDTVGALLISSDPSRYWRQRCPGSNYARFAGLGVALGNTT